MPALTRATIEDRVLQFYRRPNARAVFGTFADRAVDLIAVGDAIAAAWDVGTAEGVILDRLGEILQLPRQGADDTTYRILLRMQIQTILSSAGTTDVLLEIVRIYTGVDAPSYHEPSASPGFAEADIGAIVDLADEAQLIQFLRLAKPGGVRLTVLEQPLTDALVIDYTPSSTVAGAGIVDYIPGDTVAGADLIGYEVVI